MDQVIELLATDRALGVIAPRSLLEWSLPGIGVVADAARADSLDFYTGFAERLESVSDLDAAERDALRTR